MLLADVTLNPKTNLYQQKKNVNFTGAAATAVAELAEDIVTSHPIRRSSIQPLPVLRDVPKKLTAFLEEHEDTFVGLNFKSAFGWFISDEIHPDIAKEVAQDYATKFHEALTEAAQQALPTPKGLKAFYKNY